MSYKVRILYFRNDIPARVVYRGLTKEEAQAICSDKEGSSTTCTRAYLRKRTRDKGPWFLALDEE